MNIVLHFTAYGRPAPQGSKRHVGKGIMVESSKHLKPWRDDVKAAAEKAIADQLVTVFPLDGPVSLLVVFTVPKPKSAPKRRKTWPAKMPDLSKLIRSTEDAMTAAGVWTDDARVVEYRYVGKTYPNEGVGSLPVPGVQVWVEVMEDVA